MCAFREREHTACLKNGRGMKKGKEESSQAITPLRQRTQFPSMIAVVHAYCRLVAPHIKERTHHFILSSPRPASSTIYRSISSCRPTLFLSIFSLWQLLPQKNYYYSWVVSFWS